MQGCFSTRVFRIYLLSALGSGLTFDISKQVSSIEKLAHLQKKDSEIGR